MNKILTIIGTRPEFIRLNLIIKKLDKHCEQHILVHTGQNYSKELNQIFFDELDIRNPDYYLNAKGTFSEQISIMFPKLEEIIKKENPDKLFVLGDTNSSLCSLVAKRMHIPVYHIEAGNRSYNKLTPEETNRKIIDHCSDIHMTYTQRSKENLLNEGIPNNKIYIVGNPITEVLKHYWNDIKKSRILRTLELESKKYILVTLHREENVDIKEKLETFMSSFDLLSRIYNIPIIISCHPRTQNNFKKYSVKISDNIKIINPVGFFDFVNLELNSFCVLSDSGTVQEETNILKVPCVILRETTERPETIDEGSAIVSGCDIERILKCVELCSCFDSKIQRVVYDYQKLNTSDIVLRILLSLCYNI